MGELYRDPSLDKARDALSLSKGVVRDPGSGVRLLAVGSWLLAVLATAAGGWRLGLLNL